MLDAALPRRPPVDRARQSGVTLIEVLIAVLVLSFGLLGLAGLQWSSLQFNHSALLRSQAANLAYDMSDRLRAARDNARSGDFHSPDWADAECENDFDPTDASTTVQLRGWRCDIAALLPNGEGRIIRSAVDGDRYTVSVRWRDEREDAEAAPLVFSVTTEM